MPKRLKARPHKAKLAAVKAKLLAVSAPCTIKAGEGDGEAKGPPSFEALLYSGVPVPGSTVAPRPLDAPYVIDLSGMTRAKSVKANLDHKRTQRVGHLTEFANDGKQVSVAGLLSAATTHRDEVANSAAGGYEWEVSLEAELDPASRVKLKRGETAVVNGRTVSGPMYIFRKSVLTDLGFVSRGADDGNSVTIAASAAGEPPMNEFEKWLSSCGIDPETLTDDGRAKLQATFEKSIATATTSAAERQTLSQLAEATRQDNARIEAINSVCLSAMKEHPMYIDQIKALGEAAIDKKTSPDMFELELIRATRTKTGTFSARMDRSAADPRVVECALAMAAGLPDVEKHYKEEILDSVDRAGLRRDFSLQQLLLQVAHANGYSCRAGERITVGNIQSVLEHCFPPAYARLSGFSTVSLPGILGNVANKMILAGYMEEDQTWTEIAEIKNVSNFYQHTHYRMLDDLEYEEVGSGGELKHGTLGQESYTSQAKTYGKMLGITRVQLVNDDLGAFDDVKKRLGKGGSKKFNRLFWATFLNNSSFFTSARGNYIEGATTNLGNDGVGLETGVTKYRQMKSPVADGEKQVGVDGPPTKLLVPPELEFIADKLYVSSNIVSGDTASKPDANVHARKYRPIIQNRLSDDDYTGYSTTAWYLFGNELAPMVVSFLNGQRMPTIQSTDADFNVLGILFRAFHDWGCDQAEYLSGVKSKGAA